MNWTQLILRNLWFYRKPYLAVLAGVVISTAVLTGALIVGDSVRFSLQRLTDIRLGKIRYALQSDNRFFRQELANELSAKTHIAVAPAMQTEGIAINSDKNLRINQVQIIGVDNRFGQFQNHPLKETLEDEAIISSNTAKKLNLNLGDDLLLRIRKPGKAPSDAPFVVEKTPSVSIRVKISAIAEDDQLGRFSLKSNQTLPYNIFLSLKQLASLLELPGLANLIVTSGNETFGSITPLLDSALRICWRPADAGIHIKNLSGLSDPLSERRTLQSGIWQITSDQIFFNEPTAKAILSTNPECKTILTWLVNSITTGTRSTPYSFVSAVNESFLNQPIGQRQIIINDWLAEDLGAGPGDSVQLRYFLMGPLRSLREDSTWFTVKSIVPTKNGFADPGLMPDFPGMSDAGNCRDWQTGAPVNLKKIRDKDELYWKNFRGTPKALISAEAGKQIWGNKFGNYTAFRFKAKGVDIPGIEKSLTQKIQPAQTGLFFRPVYQEGQVAANNSTDFGELFLSLSFFILLSALLLSAMLFSLLARSRLEETGLLSSIGFRKRQILLILSIEAFIVSIAGAIPGTLAGIGYNQFMIFGLNTVWKDAVSTSQIVVAIQFQTLAAGAAMGIILSILVLIIVLWKNLRKPLSILTREFYITGNHGFKRWKLRINAMLAGTLIIISLMLLGWLLITGQTMNVMLFLASGSLMLMGGIALLNLFLIRQAQKKGETIPGFMELVSRNLSLHRGRTIAAVSLLALGTFAVIITGANHKNFYGTETNRSSGTGGFLLWAETLLPIYVNLNSHYGASTFGIDDEEILKNVRFSQLSRLTGDDASCLNLNQVSKPSILGIPNELFNQRKSFTLIQTDPLVDITQPWKSLSNIPGDNTIPGFADQTVITWGLRKSIGDTLFYRDESGRILNIKLMGALDNSIFQGNILVSDSLLRIFYPSIAGSRIMLVDGPAEKSDTIMRKLEALLQDYGVSVTPASERLASFNAVENTYLSVFMLLGGLGVIIGTIGLGIVLMRNIQQRQQELAVYMALGFKKTFIMKCIMAEHLLILFSGVFLGLISALTGILPSMISPVYKAPGLFIMGILFVILVNGSLWIWFPARAMIKKNILTGLRNE
ncbi:MAG: ABC transporter permease [Bacteroidota bacterium]